MNLSRRRAGAALLLFALLGPLPATAQERSGRVIDFGISDGKIFGPGIAAETRGGPALRLRQGERVELRWTSDRDVVLHVHAYGLETKVAAGRPTSMMLGAKAAGRFPVEMHGSLGRHQTILYIEVQPR